MARATETLAPDGSRLGAGEFPQELDHPNFGAFLLAFLWAPLHRLWGWFVVFAALEVLESVMGLSAPHFLGGLLERPEVTVAFRIVYWTVTVVFSLRANRLVWAKEHSRSARGWPGTVVRQPPSVSRYASNQRVWTWVGIVLLVATPLSLLIGAVNSVPGAAYDVAVTVGVQATLLAGLFLYDRVRFVRRRAQG